MVESGFYQTLLGIHKKYEKWIGPGFFLLGFVFDVFTLGRIDDPINIFTQSLYLILLFSFLYFEFTGFPSGEKLNKVFAFKDEIYHFFLGALLSAYTLFYFKSSSLSVSFVFMFSIIAILVLNELPALQRLGLLVKSTLLTLCLFSFFLYVIPLLIGKIGFFPFLFSLLVSFILIFLFAHLLVKKGIEKSRVENRFIFPSLILISIFILFYLAKVIPPIPLSTQHLGIYHKVEKNYPEYKLYHEKPWWKFWHTGDQNFMAQPGDKVHVFTRIFAPGGFDDKVFLHFLKDTEEGYKTSDRIPLNITGGRGEGFRGFAFKKNYTPGHWRVQVETENGLEIGRIGFTIYSAEKSERSFVTEIH